MRRAEVSEMKRFAVTLVTLSLVAGLNAHALTTETKHKQLKGRITFSGAWALYPMTIRWAEEFQKIHPAVKMDIGAGGAGKGMADCLAGVVDIGMVSREIYAEEVKKGAWWVSVTKDAVVPTVSGENPALEDLLARGVTREDFIAIWITGKLTSWGELTGSPLRDPIQVYTRSDACGAAQTWARYMGGDQEDLLGIGVYGDPGLAEAIRQDPLGIGYNNINYAYDAKTKVQVKGICVLPIDTDGNGRIDEDEDFYSTRDEIVEAIATGKYPSPPARDLHFVCHGRPDSEVVREFIRWVLTDGQKYVHEAGYINLPEEKLLTELKHLQGE